MVRQMDKLKNGVKTWNSLRVQSTQVYQINVRLFHVARKIGKKCTKKQMTTEAAISIFIDMSNK